MDVIEECLANTAPGEERQEVAALIIEELRRLHEGVLARYGLRPTEFQHWRRAPGLAQR